MLFAPKTTISTSNQWIDPHEIFLEIRHADPRQLPATPDLVMDNPIYHQIDFRLRAEKFPFHYYLWPISIKICSTVQLNDLREKGRPRMAAIYKIKPGSFHL